MYESSGNGSSIRIVVLGVGVALGIFLFVLKVVAGIETEPTRDVAAEAEVHAFTGGVSQVGIMLWGVIVGVALVAGLVMRRRGLREQTLFLLTAAAGFTLLGIDDALMFHEDVIPNHLGAGKEILFPLLCLVGLVWIYRFRAMLLQSDLFLLGLVVFGGVIAMAVDGFDLWSKAGEDWIKYVAIVALAGWVVDLALRLLSEPPQMRAPEAATPPPER